MIKSFYFLIIFLPIIFLLTNCKKEKPPTTVEGFIVNYYTNEPIDSAGITLTDGIYAGTPPSDFIYPKKNSGYTDRNGHFYVYIEEPNASPFFYAGKKGYKFDPNWKDGASVGVETIGYGLHRNKVFQLKPDTSFCATFINKGELADSMKVSFLDFHTAAHHHETFNIDDKIYVYTKNVKKNKIHFSGNGPWNTADNSFIYYNSFARYLHYQIEIKRKGIWTQKTDSLDLDNLEHISSSTYDKAVIEIN